MPRIRTIKPSFFKSEDVSALPLRARLTWVGLWTHCDDAGRTKDNARLIKGDVWPLDDVSLRDIEEDLATLADHGRIVRYEVAGARYLEIVNWHDHQKISKPTPSRLPGPKQGAAVDLPEHSESPPGTLPEASGGEGKGKEGKGREGTRASPRKPDTAAATPPSEPPPPPTCPQHPPDYPDPPPCGKCADARRARQQWDADRARRLADAPKCRKHRGQLEHNCALCRSEKLAEGDDRA